MPGGGCHRDRRRHGRPSRPGSSLRSRFEHHGDRLREPHRVDRAGELDSRPGGGDADRRQRQMGRSRTDRFARPLLPIGQSLHASRCGRLQRLDALCEGSRAQQGSPSRHVQGLARERRHQRRRYRRAVLEFPDARRGGEESRGAPRCGRRPAHFHGRSREARSRRSSHHQDHLGRRGACAGPARAGTQARFHQGLVHPPERRRSRRAGGDRQGGRRCGPRGRSAPCRARDRAHRGQGLAQSRRGFSGALGRGRAGGRGIPRPGEKEPRALLPDPLRNPGLPLCAVEYLAADRSRAAPRRSADPRCDE